AGWGRSGPRCRRARGAPTPRRRALPGGSGRPFAGAAQATRSACRSGSRTPLAMAKGLVVVALVERHLADEVEDLELPPAPYVLAQRRGDGFFFRSVLARAAGLLDERVVEGQIGCHSVLRVRLHITLHKEAAHRESGGVGSRPAGLSSWLQLARGKPVRELSWLLATRGLWLVVLEITVVSFGWAFTVPWPLFLQVIWAIGWSMIALAPLVWAPRAAVLAVGVAIVCGHNLLDPIAPGRLGAAAWLWTLLHEGGVLRVGGPPIGFAAYPVLPWIGVMALGYGLGAIFVEPARVRDRKLGRIGVAMLVAFVVLRALNVVGDARPWTVQGSAVATAMSFLDVTKYPPSLLYVLVTLGLVLSLWPVIARLPRFVTNELAVFGAVP